MVEMHTGNGKSHLADHCETPAHYMVYHLHKREYLPACGDKDWILGTTHPESVTCKQCLETEEYQIAKRSYDANEA